MVALAYLIGFATGFVVCMTLRAIFVCNRQEPDPPKSRRLRIT